MLKYAMISISALGLFSAAPILARAEIAKTPSPLSVVSKDKTPVLANVCGNGIIEEGEVCDGGNNCSGDCKGGILHTDAPSEDPQISKLAPVGEGPTYQINPSHKVEVIPSDPLQPPPHELAPADKPEFGPLPGPTQCGNGTVESGEACDDGNTMTGDGCDGGCRVEDASDSQPLADRTPRPGSRGEDSQVGFGASPLMSGSGCSLQSFSAQTGPISALAGLLLLALPLLRSSFARRR